MSEFDTAPIDGFDLDLALANEKPVSRCLSIRCTHALDGASPVRITCCATTTAGAAGSSTSVAMAALAAGLGRATIRAHLLVRPRGSVWRVLISAHRGSPVKAFHKDVMSCTARAGVMHWNRHREIAFLARWGREWVLWVDVRAGVVSGPQS